jgi:bla regulator protein blaR1
MMSELGNHLWQSTLFACMVALLTLALRKNRAAVRHGLWLAASVKFLIPFSVLIGIGSQLEWRKALPVAQPSLAVVEQISEPFAVPAPPPPLGSVPKARSRIIPAVLFGLWLGGVAANSLAWWRRWWRVRAALRAASPLALRLPIRVMSSPARLEPGVFGIRKPVLLIPEGISERLTPAQFEAIITHELCHVRRRDNLAAAIHMVVEALFWFHPLVWWIEARLVEERERACDEEVLRMAADPQDYAEGILNVCKFYLESPLVCVSGVTGADLKKRVESIMMNRDAYKLTFGRKLLLVTAGTSAVVGPLIVGALNASAIRAQSAPLPQSSAVGAATAETAAGAANARVAIEVASIKPSNPSSCKEYPIVDGHNDRYDMQCVKAKFLIQVAYGVRDFQISGGPGWLDSAQYDIAVKTALPDANRTPAKDVTELTDAERRTAGARLRLMLQSLLAERFQLKVHRETKELPVLLLKIAKGGPKLTEKFSDISGGLRPGRGFLAGTATEIPFLAQTLSQMVGRPILDQTGLNGKYDFELKWTPDQSSPNGALGGALPPSPSTDPDRPDIFAALEEQLGLKLDSGKGPVQIVVLDRVERPSAN